MIAVTFLCMYVCVVAVMFAHSSLCVFVCSTRCVVVLVIYGHQYCHSMLSSSYLVVSRGRRDHHHCSRRVYSPCRYHRRCQSDHTPLRFVMCVMCMLGACECVLVVVVDIVMVLGTGHSWRWWRWQCSYTATHIPEVVARRSRQRQQRHTPWRYQ